MSKSSLKQSLLDFQTEMKSRLLFDTFEVEGKRWKLQLLTDEEQTWALSMMNVSSALTTGASGRVANLAMGIREIDGVSVAEYYADDWDEFSEDQRKTWEEMNPFAYKYFVAEHLHSLLSAMPPDFIEQLWRCWEELLERRKEAQGMTKKSSGETSPTESNEN